MSSPAISASIFRARGFSPTGRSRSCATQARRSGQRTDILVNTLRRSETGEPLDPIAAVIEAKGCWNAELFTALGTQLVQGYMVQLRAPVGIYLVGWFDPAKWDPADSRRYRVPKETVENVRRQLEQQAAAAPEGFRVRAVVIDIAAP